MIRLANSLPSFIEVETCTACNRRCMWCPVSTRSAGMTPQLMEWPLFVRLINNLESVDYQGWIAPHNFNEPLLNTRLFRELKYLKKRLARSQRSIFTNGDHLRSEVLESLENAGVRYLRVTRYPAIVSNCKPRADIRSCLPSSEWSQKLSWKFEKSRQGFGAVARLRGMTVHVISPDTQRYVARTPSMITSRSERVSPCDMTSHSAAIDVMGRVKMCCNVNPADKDHQKYIIGSLAQYDFIDLWSSTMMSYFRSAHKRADWSLSPMCKSCHQRPLEQESPVLQATLQQERSR